MTLNDASVGVPPFVPTRADRVSGARRRPALGVADRERREDGGGGASWTTHYRGPLVIAAAARPATPPAGMPICVVVVRPVSSYGKLACRSSRGSAHTLAIESQVRRGRAAFAGYTTNG